MSRREYAKTNSKVETYLAASGAVSRSHRGQGYLLNSGLEFRKALRAQLWERIDFLLHEEGLSRGFYQVHHYASQGIL